MSSETPSSSTDGARKVAHAEQSLSWAMRMRATSRSAAGSVLR